MQGVGPDGTLYVSENFTFRTLAASLRGQLAVETAGAKRRVDHSRRAGERDQQQLWRRRPRFELWGEIAIDGDLSSQWSSNGDGDKAWIEIDLGKEYPITTIGFLTRTMGTSAQIESFRW